MQKIASVVLGCRNFNNIVLYLSLQSKNIVSEIIAKHRKLRFENAVN